MTVLRSSCAALLAFAALVLWSETGFAQLAPGDCVVTTNGGKPAVVLGPSNVAGQVMVRDLRLNEGTGQSFAPDQLNPIPCPVAPVAQNTCFASDEGQTDAQFEKVVRHALVTSLERSETQTTVALDRVALDDLRMWTAADVSEFTTGDSTQGIVNARVLYRTCIDQVTDIYVTRQENNFACFVSAANGEVVCEIAGATGDLEPPTSQSLPKE